MANYYNGQVVLSGAKTTVIALDQRLSNLEDIIFEHCDDADEDWLPGMIKPDIGFTNLDAGIFYAGHSLNTKTGTLMIQYRGVNTSGIDFWKEFCSKFCLHADITYADEVGEDTGKEQLFGCTGGKADIDSLLWPAAGSFDDSENEDDSVAVPETMIEMTLREKTKAAYANNIIRKWNGLPYDSAIQDTRTVCRESATGDVYSLHSGHKTLVSGVTLFGYLTAISKQFQNMELDCIIQNMAVIQYCRNINHGGLCAELIFRCGEPENKHPDAILTIHSETDDEYLRNRLIPEGFVPYTDDSWILMF